MKKAVSEERTFCDFCDQLGCAVCLICDKDLCKDHRLVLSIHLERHDRSFRASLCPPGAAHLLPVLERYRGKSTSWGKGGNNPEFNEAQLDKIIAFVESGPAEGGQKDKSVNNVLTDLERR